MVFGIITTHAFLTLDNRRHSKSRSLSPVGDSTPEFAIPSAKEKGRSGRKNDKGNFKTNQTHISAYDVVRGNGTRNS